MTAVAKIVPPSGRTPNRVLLVGEAPGAVEASFGRPFAGPSGREQDWYLSRHGLTSRMWRMTNVVQEYVPGNPDPTPEQVARWAPVLEQEVRETRPELVVAVGRFAAQWFLGEPATMEACHGLVHDAGCFDPERADRSGGAPVIPVYHPAGGLYDGDMKAVIEWDYTQVARVLRELEAGRTVHGPRDAWLGLEDYRDVSGTELALELSVRQRTGGGVPVLSLDTEGTPDAPWAIQVSWAEGMGLVLRVEQPDFAAGIAALRQVYDAGALCVMHNAMYDLEMARVMGLDLSRTCHRLYDTMYAAYLLRLEPQGLKPLAWRWAGMRMRDYMGVVGDVGIGKQIAYLENVTEGRWPKPEPRVVLENDGTTRLYSPQRVQQTAARILADLYADKRDKDGAPVDPYKRWGQVDRELRTMVEADMGVMPVGTLADIPLDEAVWYSARDPDATLRVYHALSAELARRDLTRTMDEGMAVLPVFEEIQANGMPASRSHFTQLADRMTDEMLAIGAEISSKHYGGRPINPNSDNQVRTLLRMHGLTGAKRTKKGRKVSTSKQSIEHLRYEEPAIGLVFDWREREHIRSAFCAPVLDRVPPDQDVAMVRCRIKTTRTATRRLASTDPNLLAIPSRTELGRMVRQGYQAPEGYLLGAWDLSQIEARFLAHESEDTLLTTFFRESRDIHRETAARVLGVGLDDVTSDQRRAAKTINFGIIYGMQAQGLYTQLQSQGLRDWTIDRCEALREGWFRVYEGVAEYTERVARETRVTGYVRDCWGMYRYLPAVWADDASQRAEAERHAVSHRVQGGAQGMIQQAMTWLRPRVEKMRDDGADVRWVLQVHDELIFLFREELAGELGALVMEALTGHCGMELRVPIEASGATARTWGELK